MKASLLFVALLLAALCAFVAADCSASITQTLGSTWKQDGRDRSQWNGVITAGSETIKSVQFSITGANIIQIWGLERQSNGLYALPQYLLQGGGLAAGQSFQFGYIWESASRATITVSSINCGSAASASPAAPSASSAPASPSAAPASASPTIVASPQPSTPAAGCSASVNQVARAGSTWTDGNFRYQIYDIAISNNGNRPNTGIRFTLGLAPGQEITQFWNLAREGSTSVFNIASFYFPLAVGANGEAGYVLRTPLSGSTATPSLTVNQVTCSGSAPSSSPAAPSPSSAPASPSAAPASPSPSTIVSTPQPSTPASGCSATISQTARSGGSWTDGNFRYQTYDLVVANNGNRVATAVQFTLGLAAGQEVTQFWNIERQGSSANVFNVASYYFPLPAGASREAGYILKSPISASTAAPSLTVNQATCGAAASSSPAAPSPSSAAPSPSAAPASPSANPTIVASPQPSQAPSTCSLSSTIVARTAAGGTWQENGNTFQIFDITITNNGQRPVRGGLASFTLGGSSPAITQFWELVRRGASNDFSIFIRDSLQVGASQIAGIIVRVSGSSAAPVPGLTISSLTCQ